MAAAEFIHNKICSALTLSIWYTIIPSQVAPQCKHVTVTNVVFNVFQKQGHYSCTLDPTNRADVIKWKHFPRYWPFAQGIHRSPVNSPHKCQWRGALIFSLICTWTNGWVNNRDPGDLRRHLAHYVTIMEHTFLCFGVGRYTHILHVSSLTIWQSYDWPVSAKQPWGIRMKMCTNTNEVIHCR